MADVMVYIQFYIQLAMEKNGYFSIILDVSRLFLYYIIRYAHNIVHFDALYFVDFCAYLFTYGYMHLFAYMIAQMNASL